MTHKHRGRRGPPPFLHGPPCNGVTQGPNQGSLRAILPADLNDLLPILLSRIPENNDPPESPSYIARCVRSSIGNCMTSRFPLLITPVKAGVRREPGYRPGPAITTIYALRIRIDKSAKQVRLYHLAGQSRL